MMRPFLLTFGGLLIFLSAMLTLARSHADGAYWLLSPRDEYNRSGLYIQQPDEGQRRMLRGFDQSMTFMWWSHDQAWIYFRTVEAFDATFYSMRLFRMRLGGTQRECVGHKLARLGGEPHSDFTPSPNSQWVAFATPEWEPNRLYVSPNDCANVTLLFDSDTEIVDSLFWSPDGEWLYFHTHEDGATSRLHRVRPDGSGLEFLTNTLVDPHQTQKTWEWSPDGAWVLLKTCERVRCSFFTFRADGGIHAKIRDSLPFAPEAVWTPDSQWILFRDASELQEPYDIFRARPDASHIERVVRLPGHDYLYGFAPDGEWVFFGSMTLAGGTLYRMRPDGSDQQALMENVALPDNESSRLIVAKDRVFVLRSDARGRGSSTLYRARIDGSDVQVLATGDFTRNVWRISPDGTHLLTTYGGQLDDPPLPMLFRMRLDGGEPQHISLDAHVVLSQFSPLFNMRWRVGWLLLIGGGMLAFHAILTKVPALFDGHQPTKRISVNENQGLTSMSILQRRIPVPLPVAVLAVILILILAVLALAGGDDGLTGSVFNATDPNAVVTALNAGRGTPLASNGTLNGVAQQMANALVSSGGTSAGDVNGLIAGSGYQFSTVGWGWTWSSWDIAADQLASQFGAQGASSTSFNDIGIASATGNGATYYAGIWAAPTGGGGGDTGGGGSGGQTTPVSSERLDGMLADVNNFRASNGACAMTINDSLVQAAIRHSENMANTDNFSHNGTDGSTHISRSQDAGYGTWVAENIAGQNPRNDGAAFQSWVNSTLGHRENMLNVTFDEIGIAVAGPSATGWYYYTMLLGSQGTGC